uniref:Tumor necrosis factor receptor superfamily, member 1a n=2 Tax=Sphaeramia orbicularis TaxID=375764 RepID=A0A672ZYI0_9TELE
MFIPAVAEVQKCKSDEVETEDGICCNMCLPGFKLLNKCQSEDKRTNCTRCPAGQYMSQPNYYHNCFSCRQCKSSRSEIVITPCKSNQNTICGCKAGYYKHIIDSKTFECVQCKKCKPEETEIRKCLPEHNTVCACKEKYYRVKDMCQPCRNCTAECGHLCPKESTTAPKDESHFLINIIAGVAVGAGVLIVLMAVITHVVTKRQIKKKLLNPSSQSSDVSLHFSEQVLIQSEEPSSSSSSVEVVPPRAVFVDRELSNLPDCVPLEIRTSDLIYTVLDVVPVAQVKQLVRSLNVTDKEIEWAEMDHRSCKEAHYQMLRVWAERGSRTGGGGRGGMLHQPLLQELLDKLRLMHLGQAAEELETKYSIQ